MASKFLCLSVISHRETPVAQIASEILSKQVRYIGFVVDDQRQTFYDFPFAVSFDRLARGKTIVNWV